MQSLFISLAFVSLAVVQLPPAADTKKPAAGLPTSGTSIDGSWTVISAEKNGQPMPEAKDMTVTVTDNTITCSGKDGKLATTLTVDFTKVGHATVTDQPANGGADRTWSSTRDITKKREAAYVLTSFVLSSDYLAVCVHDDKGGGEADAVPRATPAPGTKSSCTIFLKRAPGSDRR